MFSAATMMNGVVAGFDRNVIAAAIGTLPRSGIQISAAPTIWSPGTIRNIPTNRPIATPRGTERRVKRHRSELRMRCPNGLNQRLFWTSSADGACLAMKLRTIAARSAIAPHQPLLLPLPVAVLHRLTLVMHLLAPGKRQLDLRLAPAVEVHRQGDERQALARHGPMQLGDFAGLQQQFPRTA